MNDKEMIEEMIEEMAKCMCTSYESEKGCKTCPTNWCYADECATMAFYNGYRKIPEGALVIPNKITEETSPETLIKIAKYNEKIRKETARDFAERVKERIRFLKTLFHATGEGEYYGIELNEIEELAKQYGVEVK